MLFKEVIMTRLARRQVFIFILISLLLSGPVWGRLLVDLAGPKQVEALSGGSFQESPLRDRESYPIPGPLWQGNQGNIGFLQSANATSLNREFTKSSGNLGIAL